MDYLHNESSIVIAGEGFNPSLFEVDKYIQMWGQPEYRELIALPVAVKLKFPGKKYRIDITPNKIVLGDTNESFLTNELIESFSIILDRFFKVPKGQISGLGINVELIIKEKLLLMTGNEYCKRYLLNLPEFEDKIGEKVNYFSTGKLILIKNQTRFNVEISPYFQSDGKDLFIKGNAHQEVNSFEGLRNAIEHFNSIKEYYTFIFTNLMGISL